MWGFFGEILTNPPMVFDPNKNISASTSTYSDDFMEISVGIYTEKNLSSAP
jgi:hypothetical protein